MLESLEYSTMNIVAAGSTPYTCVHTHVRRHKTYHIKMYRYVEDNVVAAGCTPYICGHKCAYKHAYMRACIRMYMHACIIMHACVCVQTLRKVMDSAPHADTTSVSLVSRTVV
jgi:hypothetical protein